MPPGFEVWREIDAREAGIVGLLEFQIQAAADIMLTTESPLDTQDKLKVMMLSEQLLDKARSMDWQDRSSDIDVKLKFMSSVAASLAHVLAGAQYLAVFEDYDGNPVAPMPDSTIGMVRIIRPKEES